MTWAEIQNYSEQNLCEVCTLHGTITCNLCDWLREDGDVALCLHKFCKMGWELLQFLVRVYVQRCDQFLWTNAQFLLNEAWMLYMGTQMKEEEKD
jgi:hypothetical protein